MTGERTYRVIVRGTFGPLSEETRERLRERLDEHDLLAAPPWSEEGHLVYDDMAAQDCEQIVAGPDFLRGNQWLSARRLHAKLA